MARAEYFFTYRLIAHRRIRRMGKGGVPTRTLAAVTRYLLDAYPYGVRVQWESYEHAWHFSESAAYKSEARKIDRYTDRKGCLPPWNAVRGGAGGHSFPVCTALLADGRRCRNLARGTSGCCGVHERRRGRGRSV